MKNFSIKDVAEKYIGQTEIKGNMGFTNPSFEKTMKSVGWKVSYQWCALFAELVWFESFQGNEKMLKIIKDCFSASAFKTFLNFEKIGRTSKTPEVGSVVIWRQVKRGVPQWTGHAGIVTEIHKDYFVSIEGNTNDAGGREGYIVATKKRKYSFKVFNGLELVGFINPTGKISDAPFKNKKEGNKFRNWVNENHTDYAKKIDLDKIGSHTNDFIMKAWAKYGEEYAKL
tara:strand:+ start:5293 stop:5976 length:684 start_codon:yes stop_codon:yes gene_type:complete